MHSIWTGRESSAEISAQAEEKLRQAQRLEAVGQLTGGIAHDFNNILTGVIGFTTIAMNQAGENQALKETLQIIFRKAYEAAQLVQQLLAFSRKQILSKQPLALNSRVEDAIRFLERVVRDNISLESDLHELGGTVHADPTAIQQLITNLCVNAQDALPNGGMILLATSAVTVTEEESSALEVETGTYACLSVQDDGVGMDAETRLRIFEPFFTTKEAGKGTGLGLATVYGLIKQHGGTILCDSQPGRGTRFDIYLPLTPSGEDTGTEDGELEIVRGNETICIVENDADVRRVIHTYLELAGYRTLEAVDGVDGLKLFGRRESDIDLVLTDIIMPGLTGVELAGYIRKIKSDTPVVFMTGYSNHPELESLGSDILLLQKPITAGTLTNIIRKALDSAPNKG